MFTRPVACGCFVLCSCAVVPCPEVRTTFRVLVLGEIAVVAVAIRDFLHFVALFAQYDEFLLRSFRRTFWFVETSKGFAMILDTARRKSFEAFGSHSQKLA